MAPFPWKGVQTYMKFNRKESNPAPFGNLRTIIRNMTKRSFFLIFFMACALLSEAQFDTSFAKRQMRQCIDSFVTGFKTRNWELYARYTNPAVIGSFGGKYEFLVMVREMFANVPDSAWKKYEPGKILQIVRSGKDLQGVIELHSIVEWQGVRVISTAYMIGESWNNGITWTFFDSHGDANETRVLMPSLSPDLVVPAKQEKMEPLDPQSQDKTPSKSNH